MKGAPDFAAIARNLVPADPAVQVGTLPNGLRYAIMHVDGPNRGIAIRLGVQVGSFEESDGERGLAHFIEHLAFRSTRSFPNNTVDGAFAARGVAFGRDHNAATDLFSTRFELDLPRTDESDVAHALGWLRDVGDGIVFDPAAIEKERGVVLAEKEARDNAGEATQEALLRFEIPSLRAADRAPIGTDQVLRKASAEQLQAFHKRWYRPDNAVVVIVSALPAEVMKADVERAFGSWRAEGPKPPHAAYGVPDAQRGIDVFTRSDSSGLTSVDVCKVGGAEPSPPQDLTHVRREALSAIWREVLNQRLGQTRLVAENHVLGAEAGTWGDDRNHKAVCLFVKPTNDAWRPALAAGQAELLRFQASGPTDIEVEQATDAVRAHLRAAITEAANRTPSDLASRILTGALDGRPLPEPRERLRAYDLAVEDVSVADVREAFSRDWSGGGPLISVIAPEAPPPATVRTAWLASEGGTKLAAYADRKDPVWGYPLKPVGQVASREAVALGQFVRIRFRNGVVLNFKQTTLSKGKVALLVRFGAGRRQIKDQDILAATLGGALAPLGGLGKHPYDEVARIAQVDLQGLILRLTSDSFALVGDELAVNLEDQVKVTAAYLLDPAFRPTLDPLLHEAGEATYRMTNSTPALMASVALAEALAPGSPAALPPKAEVLAIDSARVSAVLRPAMITGPIDVTLVGDIDEKTAIRLVAQSFGVAPPRPAAPAVRSDTFFMRYPQTAPAPLYVEHHGPSDKAVGQMLWPLYVAVPERRREEYAIRLLAAIFSNELRREVRGELGKTYAPTVTTEMIDRADQGAILAMIDSYPADLDGLMTATRNVAKRLAAGAITDDQLAAAREPMLTQDRQAMQTNAHWASALSRSAVDDQALRDVLGFEDMLASIRLDEVKKAAADWLTRDPIVVIAKPATPATSDHAGGKS